MVRGKLSKVLLAGAMVGTLAVGSTATARPLPVTTAATIAGEAPVEQVGWRYHRRSHSGAIFAGAALGILGLAAAASIANSGYYYGGYPYYGYYPAYYSYPRVSYYAYPRRVKVYKVYYSRPVYYHHVHYGYWW